MKPRGRSRDPEAILKQSCRDLEASSCTFYIRDPWWPDQMRLVHMPGVQIREAMYGFVYPPSRKRVTGSSRFFPDASKAPELRDNTILPEGLRDKSRLFGSFADRENVQSCARFRHAVGNRIEAVLWINFAKRVRLRDNRAEMERTMHRMVEALPDMQREIKNSDPLNFSRLLQVLTPVELLAREDVDKHLDVILAAAQRAFGITPEIGYGTIHLFDPRQRTLNLKACTAPVSNECYSPLHVDAGRGNISWVAIKRRAILISDLTSSPFRELYIPYQEGMTSQLAVPMLAGDDLLGVLNLEARISPMPFTPASVRTLWYAASQAAVALRLVERAEAARREKLRSEKLLRISSDAVHEKAKRPLRDIGLLAKQWLQAADIDLWEFDQAKFDFDRSWGSYTRNGRQRVSPRQSGWSHWVRSAKVPVWIGDIRDEANFQAWAWRKTKWSLLRPGSGRPGEINKELRKQRVGAELGMPLLVKGQCVGVAWLKYLEKDRALPTDDMMDVANGCAAMVGLVMDLMRRHKYARRLEADCRDLTKELFSNQPFRVPGAEGFVVNRSFDPAIGGDFHVWQPVDPERTAFMIGDAEGHGLRGAFRMLPMVAGFRAIAKETVSSAHIMARLTDLCGKWELRGTAVCFVLHADSKGTMLFATSRTEHPLLIIKPDGKTVDFPDRDSLATGKQLGVPEFAGPLTEDGVKLGLGDVIVAYTDGVMDGYELDYNSGRREIAAKAMEHWSKSAKGIALAIADDVRTKAGDRRTDDVTIMVLKVI